MSLRRRKRDMIADALKSATEQWKEEHGWGSNHSLLNHLHGSSSKAPVPVPVQVPTDAEQPSDEPLPPLPVTPAVELSLPPLEHDVWRVAQYASVCTLIAMSTTAVTTKKNGDAKFEKLAIATLEYGLKNSSDSQPSLLRQLLLRPWIDGRSAVEWAIINNCQLFLANARVQSVIEDSWYSHGPTHWQDVPNHPCAVWKQFTCPRSLRVISDYLALWCAPRYQAILGLVVGLVYLGLHLATLANVDYIAEEPRPFEYAYYVFVSSDMLLELSRILSNPWGYLAQPSTYLSLTTAGLLTASMILRFVGLAADSIEEMDIYLLWSFYLLTWATPLMIFRLVLWFDDLHWQVYKARRLIGQCVMDALWVAVLGVFTLAAFWAGLAALQRGDVGALTMLRQLALGALHAPAISDTLFYQPNVAAVLLFCYLFVIIVVVGTLFIASFLTTLLSAYPRIDDLRRTFLAKRSIKQPSYRVFLPSVAIELVIVLFELVLVHVFRMKRGESAALIWLERTRQVIWFIIYLPVILVLGVIEGIAFLMRRGRHVLSGYQLLK
ncbi:hypothetical protein BX666DRAFT_1989810 [Dichotomocladium elegans]|nr:hypothetical protein BX666DRAFT_1989810 [Dichotomocladium elegans]